MLKLYNTLTRKKEAFKPQSGKTVTIYACGPTVYDNAHIGNLRTYVFEDTLRRWLKHGHGLEVKQAMNITDIEDKIIAASKARSPAELVAYTKPYEERFFADLDTLRIERAESYPKATAHIKPMITMIKNILKTDYAYERDGSVYFDVRKYNEQYGYGKLLKIDLAGFNQHHRINNDEYDKESIQDFALWKAVPKGSPGWESPWGHGRPGWHIECSVMAGQLGQTVDIHAGGVDLIFPHHENEIAQSAAANGKPLANYWLHAEHLLVNGKKMAKSAKNYYTLEDIEQQGFSPLALRILFLQSHYRSKLNFTTKSIKAAQASHERLQEFLTRLDEEPSAGSGARVTPVLKTAMARFTKALNDDLNTAEALSVVFDLVGELNAKFDSGGMTKENRAATKEIFREFDKALAVVSRQEIAVPKAVAALVAKREKARQQKDFKGSDRLRKQIERQGFQVEDTAAGPRVRKISG